MSDSSYTADAIKVLEGLEAVRKRPGMYIGSTGPAGLHHLIWELVDNSVDEALAGHAKRITVTLHEDGSVSVEDDGRGIPVDIMPEYGKRAFEVVLTVLHAGGKFDASAYKVSGGLHGVGLSVVNALSSWLLVRIRRDGKEYEQEYARGIPLGEVKIRDAPKDEHGTLVRFKPDPEIFHTLSFDREIIRTRLRETAYLTPGLTIIFKDEEEGTEEVFHSDEGLPDFLRFLNEQRKPLHEDIIHVRFTPEDEKLIEFEYALQYTQSYGEAVYSFVNTINTPEGGTHVSAFRSAVTRAVQQYAQKYYAKEVKRVKLQGVDIREGLTAILHVKLREPQFEGQTKAKLGSIEVKTPIERAVYAHLSQYLEEHPRTARIIIQKVLRAAQAREAAAKARELVRRKSLLETTTLPGKLADCSSRERDKTELFIVEGDSAGGNAKQARQREYQAVLPLRGKLLNVEKAHVGKMLKNKEIQALITAIGTGIGDQFSLDQLRYGKIIILTDADVDGAHIRTLLLTFFFRYMRPLIEEGHIYIAQPPLYRVQKGKHVTYALDDTQLEALLKEKRWENAIIQRFKGLGEMNPDQLWETTMNPETRILKRVMIEDAVYADRLFTLLMGSEVEPRRAFIQQHALEADLDV